MFVGLVGLGCSIGREGVSMEMGDERGRRGRRQVRRGRRQGRETGTKARKGGRDIW